MLPPPVGTLAAAGQATFGRSRCFCCLCRELCRKHTSLKPCLPVLSGQDQGICYPLFS